MSRNGLLAIVLVGVLGSVGPVQGAITLQITQLPDPAAGLNSYRVTAVSDGPKVFTFSDLTITGVEVHNVADFTTTESLTIDFWTSPGTFTEAAWSIYDTHVLIPDGDLLTSVGPALAEGNDQADPVGLALAPAAFPTFPAKVGMGTFGHSGPGASFVLLPENAATSVDFLQVVVLDGDVALLTVGIVDENQRKDEFVDVPIVPEPATMTLLALGGAALLRRRR